MHMLFPALLRFTDVGLLLLRLMVAVVFLDSGWNHLKNPVERSKSIGARPRCSSPSPPRRSRRRAKATNLYLHADGTLSFDAPAPEARGATYRAYVSDPANPVPYRQRPITPTYPAGDWRTWEVQDQRFVDQRPDVVTFVSVPLDHDLTNHRRGGGRPVRVDLRQRCRRRGQADRCLSRGRAAEHLGPGGRSRAWAVCALRQRLRATHRHGGPARPISRELRAPAPAHSEHAARVEDPAPRPGPRLSEGSPPDGAGAIDLVPPDRPQPAKVCPEHLRRDGGRFHQGDPARVLLPHLAVAHRAACRAVGRPGGSRWFGEWVELTADGSAVGLPACRFPPSRLAAFRDPPSSSRQCGSSRLAGARRTE